MKNIFIRLVEERQRLGLNKGQMAKAGNVANSTYTNYEEGNRSPDGEFFAAIAAAGADVLYILTGTRVGEIKFSPEIPLTITREEAAFLDNYRHSPKDAQESMKTMCAALAQRGVKKDKAA